MATTVIQNPSTYTSPTPSDSPQGALGERKVQEASHSCFESKWFAIACTVIAAVAFVVVGLGLWGLVGSPSSIPGFISAISPYGLIAMTAVGGIIGLSLTAIAIASCCKRQISKRSELPPPPENNHGGTYPVLERLVIDRIAGKPASELVSAITGPQYTFPEPAYAHMRDELITAACAELKLRWEEDRGQTCDAIIGALQGHERTPAVFIGLYNNEAGRLNWLAQSPAS